MCMIYLRQSQLGISQYDLLRAYRHGVNILRADL